MNKILTVLFLVLLTILSGYILSTIGFGIYLIVSSSTITWVEISLLIPALIYMLSDQLIEENVEFRGLI